MLVPYTMRLYKRHLLCGGMDWSSMGGGGGIMGGMGDDSMVDMSRIMGGMIGGSIGL